MNILVTGGTGFLGRHVVAELQSRGHSVHAPSSAVYDLRDPEQVAAALAYTSPEAVVHLAAIVGGIGANAASPGRFFHDNASMGLELMEQARVAGVEKFVTVGTACSYPADAPQPLHEDTIWDGYPAEPTAPYGLAKRMLLAQGQAYRREYGFNAIHVIPTNLYGPGDNFDLEAGHVVAMMVRKFASSSDGVELWGDGSPTRDLLYVTDAARGIALATESYDDPQPVNLGTGVETSIATLAARVAEFCGYPGMIFWDRRRPNGTPRRVMDVSRARSFGFEATMPLIEGLQRTVRSYREAA